MEESVVFNSPVLLVGVLIAIALLIVEQKTKDSGYVLPISSMVLSLGMICLAFLYGAAWAEILLLVSVFLVITIFGYKPGGEEK